MCIIVYDNLTKLSFPCWEKTIENYRIIREFLINWIVIMRIVLGLIGTIMISDGNLLVAISGMIPGGWEPVNTIKTYEKKAQHTANLRLL